MPRILFASMLALLALVSTSHATGTAKLKTYVKKYSRELPAGSIVVPGVACKETDLALSGHLSFKVPESEDPTDVHILGSHLSNFNNYIWTTTVHNNTAAVVEATVTVVCLKASTNGGKSAHQFVMSPRYSDPHLDLAPGTYAFDHSGICPEGSIAVAPGFEWNSEEYRPFRLWTSADSRGMSWSGEVISGPADIDLRMHCLELKTTEVEGHQHEIVQALDPDFAGAPLTIASGGPQTWVSICEKDESSIVNYYSIDDPTNLHFLGDTAKKYTSTFSFAWNGTGDDGVRLATRCLKKELALVP